MLATKEVYGRRPKADGKVQLQEQVNVEPPNLRGEAIESQQSRKVQQHSTRSANLESICPEGQHSPKVNRVSPKDARMTQ